MTTLTAVETFWAQLAESGLLPARQVKYVARELAQEGVNSDAVAAKQLVRRGLLTRYQAERLLEGRSRGFFFDEYKLLDLLGIGGMGWVYRAENTGTGGIVALKVLLDQLKHDRGMLARFEQEARAGLRFNHENIVRTFACGSAGGLPYVIMEFVEGPSLLELLKTHERCRLPWEQACEIARQAALGLHHMHQAGFVHRDVKPQNLLIDRAGHVKLLDFGLSMLRDGEDGDEFSMAMIFGHECVGTAAFTAPEQSVDSLTADARSDVYSLGCTLYASLVGDTPFPYPNSNDVHKAHQSQVPRNVCDIVPTIPRAVGDIIAKMLAKRPADRFASAADVATELSVWSKSMPVEFDFTRILAERNKSAQEKLAEFHKRQRTTSGAASSTARPASQSSVASVSSGQLLAAGTGNHSPSSSSIARRSSFAFEHPPAILVRHPIDTGVPEVTGSTNVPDSTMVLVPLGGGANIRLVKNRFVLGRGVDCDLQIQDASVSTRHCELRFDGHNWTIVDLRSRNGIRVNGELVQKQRLRPGDTIVVGSSLRLRFGDMHGDIHEKSSRRFLYSLIGLIAVSLITTVLVILFW